MRNAMIKFKDYVEESNKKNPVMFTTNMVQHPTGFPYLDYGSGGYLTIYDDYLWFSQCNHLQVTGW